MMKRVASEIRTGDIITTVWAMTGGRRDFTLEVAYPVRERFTSPEGTISEVIRFSGWDQHDEWRERTAGVRVTDDVYLIREAEENPFPFGRALAVFPGTVEDEIL